MYIQQLLGPGLVGVQMEFSHVTLEVYSLPLILVLRPILPFKSGPYKLVMSQNWLGGIGAGGGGIGAGTAPPTQVHLVTAQLPPIPHIPDPLAILVYPPSPQ